MNYYKIVNNTQELESFIEFLPDLNVNETYYFNLIARPKYSSIKLSNNTNQIALRRFTTSKEKMFDKIKQLECEVGSYKVQDIVVPQEALALYMTINPRNTFIAAKKTSLFLAELFTNNAVGKKIDPAAIALTEIHRARSRKLFFDIDFDLEVNGNFHDVMKRRMAIEHALLEETGGAIEFLNTRGGFHALVKLKEIPQEKQNTWFMNVSKLSGLDIKGDNMIPVPGTTQGGFVPTMYLIDEVYNFKK